MTQPAFTPPAATRPFAGWWSRVGAVIVDSIPTAIVFGVLTAAFGESESTSSSFSFQLTGLPFVVYVLFGLGWFVYNWIIRQGSTGQTIGKKMLGITVLSVETQKPLGGGLNFARQLVHILDSLPCGLGYLWPIWDAQKRTFADMLMSSRVYKA